MEEFSNFATKISVKAIYLQVADKKLALVTGKVKSTQIILSLN